MRTLLTIAAAAALVSACGQTADPTAQPATATSDPAELWDPCTLSDDVLIDAQLLPQTKNDNHLFEGWQMCSWDGPSNWYSVGAYSTTWDLDQFFRNPKKSDFQESKIAGREVWMYRQESELPADAECSLVIPTKYGSVDLVASKYLPRDRPDADMCDVLTKHVELLLPSLPK